VGNLLHNPPRAHLVSPLKAPQSNQVGNLLHNRLLHLLGSPLLSLLHSRPVTHLLSLLVIQVENHLRSQRLNLQVNQRIIPVSKLQVHPQYHQPRNICAA
jgi:hypothetical protein